jgi:hypothetical protein
MFRCQVRDAEGMWGWPGQAWLPLPASLRAMKQG